MDGGDIYKAGNSLRASSSSAWRNTTTCEVFMRSSYRDEEEDEEALKWAAIEKLPTYNRLRKGLLTTSRGGATEIDITTDLGFQERQRLLGRLINVPEKDNEKFLMKLKQRIDRVGIDIPTIEVRYENLRVEAEVYQGTRALPTLLNSVTNMAESVLSRVNILRSKKKHITILKNVSGIVKPGRMTLLLGPPGSGKTTLLKVLSGKVDPTLKVCGKVSYNGYGMKEFVPQRTAAYIGQHDVHLAEMTVRETLTFSAQCQGVGSRYDLLCELSRREKEAQIIPDPDIDIYFKAATTGGQEASLITDYVLKILGLDICADTMVGNEMFRGISGGQRKRVTTGEMLVGPANALFMDEISTGLDSSTTFQIVNSIREYIHIFCGTAVISLLQPAPETYELFDDIVLISDGVIVYHGPRDSVLEFFEYVGFKCPERKGVADYLQEVTSKKDQEQYWVNKNQPYTFVNVTQFAEAFKSFHIGKRMEEELGVPFDKSKSHPAALTTQKYGISNKELLKVNISRELLLMKRNAFINIFKICQLSILSFISMTLFLRTNMHKESVEDQDVWMGCSFIAVVVFMFNGMSEILLSIARLPVFYKQRDHLFYPPWAYGIPSSIIKIPPSFVESAVWVSLTYYVIGYDPNVWRLLKQYMLLVLVNTMASGLFRAVASLARNLIVAVTFGSSALSTLFNLGGFVLSRKDIKNWWIWGYWISPMMYGQHGIVVNEFLGHSWKKLVPGSNKTLGVQILESRGFFPHAYWYWIAFGALIGFIIIFNIVYVVALTYLQPYDTQKAIVHEEEGDEGDRGNGRGQQFEVPCIESSGRVNGGMNGKKKGMVLPFEPHSITFDQVTYSVDMPKEMKDQGLAEERLVLLKGVSGAFRPGVLTALMGVSGAGKTTLMDVLAGRKTSGYIEGSIKISGYPKKQETFARISGYCEQNDIHSPHVTVYESLLYSAWLRLPRDVDSNTRKMFIEEVMKLVELDVLRNSLVGLPGGNGLSTEQRKRLTIAVELVANPSIIFMDEPTSGLDARAAAIVMRTVRNTVDTGRTVVCTIHQPSIDIFESFDELFLLKRGGQEIYVGPLGLHSRQLIKYFESIEGVSPIKDGYNPATWMLEVTTPAQEVNLGVDFNEIYKNSDLYRRNKQLIAELGKAVPGSKDLYFDTKYSQSFWVQCKACLWKQYWSYWRNPPYTAVRYFSTTMMALLLGSVFWDIGRKYSSRQDLSNAMGSMQTASLFLGSQNSASAQPVVAIERSVFYRERAAGMYSALPYAFGQVVIEIPYIFVQALTYTIIIYSMIGYEWSGAKFFWTLYFMFCTFCYFTFFGMMTVSISPNAHVAPIIAGAFYSTWFIFSGFTIRRPRMPIWWRWNYWACPVAWTLYGLIGSQYGDVTHVMEEEHVSVKEFIREYFGIKHDFLGVVAVVIASIALFFAFTFAVAIKFCNFERR